MPAKPSEVSSDNDMVSKTHNFGSSERVVEDDVIEHSENLEVKIRKTELIPPLQPQHNKQKQVIPRVSYKSWH